MNKMDNANSTEKKVWVPIEAPKVNAGLIVRCLVYLAAIVNGVAAFFGWDFHLEISQDWMYNLASMVFMVGSFVHAFWKNQNVSKKARIKEAVADQVHPNL